MTVHLPISRHAYLAAVGTAWVALVLLWLVDLSSVTLFRHGLHNPAAVVPVVTGPAFATLVLAPAGRFSLWARVVVAIAGSWALTLFFLLTHYRPNWSWGLLETGALLTLLMLAARHITPVTTVLAQCVALGSAIVIAPLRTGHGVTALSACLVLTFCAGAILVLGCYLRAQDARRRRTVAAVREHERLELARELHDFVAHHVTGIVVQVQAARTIGHSAPEQVDQILRNIEKGSIETLDSMRRLVGMLRQPEEPGIWPDDLYTGLADLVARSADLNPTLDITDRARQAQLVPEVATSIQRVVQEALTNVRRHAPGTTVAVHIDTCDGQLLVQIRNSPPPGRASPSGGRGGFGLMGMRERAEAVGGALAAGPTDDGGWQVTARLPVRNTEGQHNEPA
ncbi:sensor histidine kinase [Nocardia sp. JMUB6875]|uniref:sensor histidine kinase n=1 Tax=Nocardia sp. JMUB6875 TaxID=3158170 RepID=UPI0034E88806